MKTDTKNQLSGPLGFGFDPKNPMLALQLALSSRRGQQEPKKAKNQKSPISRAVVI